MRGWEWGSGRSTLWFARRLAFLTSIESDPVWFEQVRGMVSGLSNVELRLVPLEHPNEETYAFDYPVLPANAAAIEAVPDASLDFVVVDGWYRPV